MFDYIRVAAAVPTVKVGDTKANVREILKQTDEALAAGSQIIAFPELALTGYTCADLFFQKVLCQSVSEGLTQLVDRTLGESFTLIVGAPIPIEGQLYNCAVVISAGKIVGISVKTFLSNYGEFYEKRWFSSASDLQTSEIHALDIGLHCEKNYTIPVGADLIYRFANGASFGVEICEDLWAPLPPSTFLAMGGAHIIFNLSASNETLGKRQYRRELIKNQSARLFAGYVFVSAGPGESTTDVIFSGDTVLCENGKIFAENREVIAPAHIQVADMDFGKLDSDRMRQKTFGNAAALYGATCRTVHLAQCTESDGALYPVSPHPFVPKDSEDRTNRCRGIFEMQVAGLQKRLQTVGARPVIGVSGGLDSTLALLVSCEAVRRLGREASDVCAITMPCFGTTNRTYDNAIRLMKQLEVTALEIPIRDACIQHCKDIDHPVDQMDVTFENIQARERTQVLMDYASKIGGLVVGTGDLSELALGWCTYNADHMSMYGVNAGVPKTLMRWMIDSMAKDDIFPGCREILLDILDTPISPELLPPDENGKIAQQTEDIVGPYELHDFFLYYALRFGFSPRKIYYLAKKAFEGKYDERTLQKWMQIFYKRFFTQQYKRSCQPDGVKVGSIALSPRGDWRMPSDAAVSLWLEEAESLKI